jgi:Ca2+-binding EF-hand superfamily protein
MGAAILKPRTALPPAFPKLIEETQFFSLWKISDVKELYKRLRLQVYGYALVEAQFESIMAFKEDLSKQTSIEVLFDILDNDHNGRIDGLELLGGLALCCQATFEEKARFCFELYDFNLTSSISKREMIMMMMASICGMNLLTGGGEELEPDVDTIELLSDEAFLRADREKNGLISYEEFVSWVRSNRHLMAALESLNKVALDAKLDVESDDSAPETDDGDLSDIEPAIEQGATGRMESSNRDNTLISSQSIAHAISARLLEIKSPLSSKVSGISTVATEGAQTQGTLQWRGQIYEPTSMKVASSFYP